MKQRKYFEINHCNNMKNKLIDFIAIAIVILVMRNLMQN